MREGFLKRLLCMILVIGLFAGINSAYANAATANTDVEGFVTRLYNICLDRQPDTAGFNDWVSQLKSGRTTGATAAYGFIFSKEFKNKNLCNDCYVTSLYRCFLGREPDAAGKKDWLNRLAAGQTRGTIFNGFVGSNEFSNICKAYGINRGSGDWSNETVVITGNCQNCGKKNKTVTDFVTRLYNVCLDRNPDEAGLNDWINQLKNGKTGAEVAYGFIFSSEFKNKNLCNEHFVEYMYKAFFNRNSDTTGRNTWTKLLNGGGTKGSVFSGFIGSQEFKNLCAEYGIKTGTGDYGRLHYTANGSCTVCAAETHQHTWVTQYETVYHDAEYKTVHHDAEYKTIHHDAVYDTVYHPAEYMEVQVCKDCGAWNPDHDHLVDHALAGGKGGTIGEVVEVKAAWTEEVLISDAYDEQVLVKEAWDEQVLVKAAYTEQVANGEKCSGYGATR